jgi:hypothetical protein
MITSSVDVHSHSPQSGEACGHGQSRLILNVRQAMAWSRERVEGDGRRRHTGYYRDPEGKTRSAGTLTSERAALLPRPSLPAFLRRPPHDQPPAFDGSELGHPRMRRRSKDDEPRTVGVRQSLLDVLSQHIGRLGLDRDDLLFASTEGPSKLLSGTYAWVAGSGCGAGIRPRGFPQLGTAPYGRHLASDDRPRAGAGKPRKEESWHVGTTAEGEHEAGARGAVA